MATNVCDLVARFYLSLGQWASDSEQVVTRVSGVGRKHEAEHFSFFFFLVRSQHKELMDLTVRKKNKKDKCSGTGRTILNLGST